MADIGRRAAHIKANDLRLAPQNIAMGKNDFSRACHANDATGRPRKDGVFALKSLCVHQPARGLHEQQRHTGQLQSQLIHIAAQNR